MIEIVDVWKTYGTRPALAGVSAEIRAGERVALVGPNGSGKTTLLRCLLGLVSYRGKISVCGHDPLRDHRAAQTHVAYVPQRAPTLPVPVSEVVGFWARERARPAEALVEATARFGLDLREVWRRPFVALSGGMQQKLLAASAIAAPCDVLLLDEPTANLDPAARQGFFAAVAARDPHPTVILSSHRLDEICELVDRVIVLRDGKIAFDDRLDAFLADRALASAAGLDRNKIVPFSRSA